MRSELISQLGSAVTQETLDQLKAHFPEANLGDVIHIFVSAILELADIAENTLGEDFDGGQVVEHVVADLNGSLEERALEEQYQDGESDSELNEYIHELLKETQNQVNIAEASGNTERAEEGRFLLEIGEALLAD